MDGRRTAALQPYPAPRFSRGGPNTSQTWEDWVRTLTTACANGYAAGCGVLRLFPRAPMSRAARLLPIGVPCGHCRSGTNPARVCAQGASGQRNQNDAIARGRSDDGALAGGGRIVRTTLADAAAALSRDGNEAAMRDAIAAAPGASAEHVAILATALAASGEMMPRSNGAADVASTGGPGSLTTLVTSSLLVAAGWIVPKIGVAGRPAGGIDSLGSLPGFRVDLDRPGFAAALDAARHVHVRAGGTWAPADAALFALRQRTNTQAVPELAAASLLSKKIAAGVSHAVLDVRVAPHGNFGRTVAHARAAARLFVDAAAVVGIVAAARLSDASGPQQPWIGRGEALLALRDVVDGTAEGSLAQHAAECASLAAATPGTPPVSTGTTYLAASAVRAHLAAQGCDEQVWRDRAAAVAAAHRTPLLVSADGYFALDMAEVRDALVTEQRTAASRPDAAYSDPAGVVLLAMPGDLVAAGTPVVSVRHDGGGSVGLAERIASAIAVVAAPPGRADWHGEMVI